MNLGELIAAARIELNDTAVPYLWDDLELKRYINDAENEACRRARLIVDSTTTEVCKYAVKAGQVSIELDPRIVFVRRFKLASSTRPVGKIHLDDLDEHCPGWEDHTGTPQRYVENWQTGHVRLYPAPDATDTAWLTVVRLPLEPMVDAQDTPEISQRFHESLLRWVCYRAYSKEDVETKNEKKALDALALFEQEFGKRSSAIDETWIQQEYGYDKHEGLY